MLLEEHAHRVEEHSFEPSAEKYIDRLALREGVWAALYELPEVLRVTSAILGVPVSTVKSHLNQAILRRVECERRPQHKEKVSVLAE